MSAMSDGEINDILVYVKRNPHRTLAEVSAEFGRDIHTISKLLKRLRPTTELARATLLSRANELVTRVADKADIDQLIDVLSRPNVGVLDPVANKGGGGAHVGILVSVSPAHLAALTPAAPEPLTIDAPAQPMGGVKKVGVGSVPVGQFFTGE